jgi:arylsulfatase A-like enzyme
VDWYPTLVKLAGGSLEQKLPLDGKDIWPVVAQGAKTPHDALLLSAITYGKAAVRMGDWKLLGGAGNKGAAESAGHGDELYNLASDIGEKRNLASEMPEKVKELQARLDQLLKDAVPCGQVADADGAAKNRRKKAK